MDLGVGGFVFASAMSGLKAQKDSWASRALKSLRSAAPMILLGMLRLFSVKSVDYQEHVSEYGVHWNFFFTLAFLTLGLGIFDWGSPRNNAIFGLILLLCYQAALQWFGLAEYIEHHQRSNLFHANKEGFLSLAGYISLYWFGSFLGEILRRPRPSTSAWKSFLLRFASLDFLLFFISVTLHDHVHPCSRRMVWRFHCCCCCCCCFFLFSILFVGLCSPFNFPFLLLFFF